MDLRRINHLIKQDNNEYNFSLTTIAYAAWHMACKKYFCYMNCSQASRRQTSNQSSYCSPSSVLGRLTTNVLLKLKPFSFSVYKFCKKKLDQIVNADRRAQYVDDNGIAAHTTHKLIRNINIVFKCTDRTEIKKLQRQKLVLGNLSLNFK